MGGTEQVFHIDHTQDKCGTGTSAAPKTSAGGIEGRPGWATLLRESASQLLSLGRCETAKRQLWRAFKTNNSRARAPSAPLAFPFKDIWREAVLSPKKGKSGPKVLIATKC